MGEVSKFTPFSNMDDVAFCSTWESMERIGGSNYCATRWFILGFRVQFGLGFWLMIGLRFGIRYRTRVRSRF